MRDDIGGHAPAFPIRDMNDHPGPMGVSIREYFAGKAIAGILANPDISASAARCNVSTEQFREDTARAAYAMADAMLAEHDK